MGTPKPPKHSEVIYQRRRIAALVVLLLVVALIIWAVVALRGGASPEQTQNAAETSTAEATTPSPEATTTATSPSASAAPTTTTATQAADAKKTCELADLVLTATSDKPNYGPGEQPQLFMTVANPTAADCRIDLDEQVLRFEIYDLATNARVWSDVDCNPAVETGTREFPAGEERYFQATWSRTTSAPQQCSSRQEVPVGSYYLHTVIGTNPSQALTFNLG
ncbi:hypothetical protein [Corynebacterium pacaense]|uniref:hypothetical protein n=1 Tax=Corynebacterium pacaense TaxID=1816684 RepID=UPI0009BA5027|nr:hypothetical protein [Corynebacterium pacaense]